MILFIVGFMGSGKSSVARNLANVLGKEINNGEETLTLIDLDNAIENRFKLSISAIFLMFGEEYFRYIESSILREVVEKEKEREVSYRKSDKNDNASRSLVIFSLGGGTPCFNENMSYILKLGKVIYLYLSFEKIVDRLARNNNRPLSKKGSLSDLELLYNKRQEVYNKANLIINTEFYSKQEVVSRILRSLNKS